MLLGHLTVTIEHIIGYQDSEGRIHFKLCGFGRAIYLDPGERRARRNLIRDIPSHSLHDLFGLGCVVFQ